MEQKNRELVRQVLAAQKDSHAADDLIEQYMGFIKSETAKFLHRPPTDQDDHLPIAMMAFYEVVLAYKPLAGAFLPLAAKAIRNRLIDFSRRESRHSGEVSLQEPQSQERDVSLEDTLADPEDKLGDWELREASAAEIREFGETLSAYGLSYTEVAESCPQQERTLKACHRALAYAREHRELIGRLTATHRLPIGELSVGAGVERKTLERHRAYMMAIMLAYTNGFELIRGHLCEVDRGKEEQ